MKKIFFTSLSLFLVSLGLFLFSKFGHFFNKSQVDLVIENNNSQLEYNQSKKEKKRDQEIKFLEIASKGVAGAALYGSSSQIIFYQNQNFLISDFNGESKSSLASYPFLSVEEIVWEKEGKKALVKSQGRYYYFNIEENKAIQLKDGIDLVRWNMEGDKIIYKYFDAQIKRRSLDIANPDGSDWKSFVKDFPYPKINFQIKPQSKGLIYYPNPSAKLKSECFFVLLDGSQHKKIFDDKYGADFLFSPNGKKILVSSASSQEGNKMVLGVANENGGEYRGFRFATSVKKCVWSKDSRFVFCAIMGGLPSYAILPDEWEEGKYKSEDFFWKIDTETGKMERLLEKEEISKTVDAVNLFLDKSEQYLFFIDRISGGLFRIAIN